MPRRTCSTMAFTFGIPQGHDRGTRKDPHALRVVEHMDGHQVVLNDKNHCSTADPDQRLAAEAARKNFHQYRTDKDQYRYTNQKGETFDEHATARVMMYWSYLKIGRACYIRVPASNVQRSGVWRCRTSSRCSTGISRCLSRRTQWSLCRAAHTCRSLPHMRSWCPALRQGYQRPYSGCHHRLRRLHDLCRQRSCGRGQCDSRHQHSCCGLCDHGHYV